MRLLYHPKWAMNKEHGKLGLGFMLGSCIVMEVTHVKCCYSVIQGIARVTMQNLEGLKSWYVFKKME